MTLMSVLKQAEKFTSDHSPQILTAIGVTGTITTAVLTGKATYKYMQNLGEEGYFDRDYKFERTPRQHVEKAWKLYIPPVASGVLTVASIIVANQIGTRRSAAMAAAYVVSEKAFAEYKEQVIKKFGETKEQMVRDDLAQAQVNRSPLENRQIIIAGGNVLCYEPYTDRYFESDMESLKKAQNDLNYQINNNYFASLSDFYDLIGLPHTEMSDELGWNSDELLELNISTCLASDGRPALSFTYNAKPIRGYSRVH